MVDMDALRLPLTATGRFGVDIDVDSQRRAIKPVNLTREVKMMMILLLFKP